MSIVRNHWKSLAVLAFLAVRPAGATSPITATFFGNYGSLVAPLSIAPSFPHGFGFTALAEWNPSDLVSVGLSYEQMTLLGEAPVPDLSLSFGNLEGHLFPFGSGSKSFSPYLYAGAGLNLNSKAGVEPFQLKVGLGTRVSLAGPLFLDLGAGSHWITDPGAFQYVEARAGLSYSFEIHEAYHSQVESTRAKSSSASEPAFTAKPAAKPTPETSSPIIPLPTRPVQNPLLMALAEDTPTAVPTATPKAEEQVEVVVEMPTPTAHEAASAMMKYYRIGSRAYLKQDYLKALKYLKKSAAVVDHEVRPVFYSEANALIGVVYYVKKNPKSAGFYLRKALRLNPGNPAAKKYIKKLGKSAKKKTAFKKPVPTPTVEY